MEKLFVDEWFKMPPKKELERKYTIKISDRKAGLKYGKKHNKKVAKTKAKKRG